MLLVIRGAIIALGAVLALVGLGGIQGDIEGWASFLDTNANLTRTVAVVVGAAVVVAGTVGPRLFRWWTQTPGDLNHSVMLASLPPSDDGKLINAVLRAQLSAGRQRLAQAADLKSDAENAEARAIALRLYTDEWRLPVELALATEGDTLEDFRRTVDTQQMHYIDAAPHTLRVLLERLRRVRCKSCRHRVASPEMNRNASRALP